ncbi:hypothetical protein NXV53_13445 [Bacteroides faecis]|uniref:hypothetical protein n=2 Tax=Bacteroides faecis TaxID=674529 RepID=UPI002165E5B0|nr:hypothetical protein [Bacteroides faecis]MCS2576380.1 hypothetical protein [Bacteroides faecis]MCS3325575.1 hypothetical protein [Bacteroides faecis]
MNAIRLGVPVASSGSGRPYIDPELLSHVKMAISTWGKTNDDPDRAVLKDLSGNGNDMRLLNFGFTEGSGYGLPGTDFEGWLCTDGVDDMIESVKPVSEMLEGSNEITVVSIIHQISQIPRSERNKGLNNQIVYYDTPNTRGYLRNIVSDIGGTGIYGYTFDGTTHAVINNILGDKDDYTVSKYNQDVALNGILSICGYKDPNGVLRELSQIAYAGGFIANKVLTTDEINQVIAYYNLDRPGQIIKPQLYYNVKKQSITNENHAEFNDQLIDFVGDHNIQLNNIGWEGESGINSYPVVFGANKTWDKMASSNNTDFIFELTGNSIHLTKANDNLALLFTYVYNDGTVNEVSIPTFKLKVTGLKEGQNVVYNYVSEDNVSDITSIRITEDGEYVCPKSTIFVPAEILSNVWIGFKVNPENIDLDITIEVLPTIEHALSLDGINDFGKVTGLPVVKDYTVAALRKWLYDDSVTSTETGSIVSKSKIGGDGAFILEQTLNRKPPRSSTFSFGASNSLMNNDKLDEESFTYQTKYSYNGNPIQAGAGIDSDSMWLGTIRDGDSRFSKLALWSLMLFPYSLSEFLLERQLRKYKAGTLYPDMIEFRPIVKSNIPYSSISYSVNPGVYVTEGSAVTITITLSNASDKLVGVSSNAISDISISGDNGTYEITGKVTKSPQKISIVISSYLTMLGNDTLISNETLIKNE